MKIKAHQLTVGTVMQTGEVVKLVVKKGGRLLVRLEKDGKTRDANWNASSTFFVR